METRQRNKLNTLVRILLFLDRNANDLGGVSRSAVRMELDALVQHLDSQGRQQATAGGGLRLCLLRREALRRDLLIRHLRPIAAIAQVTLDDTPGAAAFRLPGTRMSHRELLARAEAMGAQAAKHRQVFLQNGFAHDFVEQLLGLVDAMDRLDEDCRSCLRRRCGATYALADAFSRAARVVSVLDTLVHASAGRNRALLTAWIAVRRGEVVGGRPMSLAS
jgi:hypothetical protein